MARNMQDGADRTDRRSKAQSERELVASNQAAELSGLGVAAGTMILGALLPHQADAAGPDSQHHAPTPLPVEREHQASQPPNDPNPPPDAHATAPAPQSGDSSNDISSTAMPSSAEPQPDHRHDGVQSPVSTEGPLQHGDHAVPASAGAGPISASGSDSGPASHADAASASHAPAELLSSAPETIALSVLQTDSQAIETAAHTVDTASGALVGVIDVAHSVASSVSQSLTSVAGDLSASIGTIAHSLSAPFQAAADNPVDTILSQAEHLLTDTHAPALPTAPELPHPASPALAGLASLPASVLGGSAAHPAADGIVAQTLASAAATPEAHPSAASYGDILQPIHIGFIGQSLAHTMDAHDISSHGLGSILHGFV